MPSEKRQRQDEGRLGRRLAEVEATKRRQRSRSFRTLALILGGLIAVAALVSVFGGGDDDEPVATGSSSTTAGDGDGSSTTAAAGAPITVVYPGPGASITGETPCPAADGSSERTTSFTQEPPRCIQDGVTYTATVETTEGTMTFELDQAKAPNTVNNFVVLARYHYYDGVPFHRIIPGFVDQAGTPVDQADLELIEKTPGYTIAEELPDPKPPASEVYPDGTLAMAKQAAPHTTSSQFFIVVGDGGSRLSVDYTPFGRVTEGLEVAKAINAFGDEATNGEPTKDIRITKVTINEG